MDKVLVVDDDKDIQVVISHYLKEKYEVTCFSSPVKALRYIMEKNDFSLIITDILMPEMSGIELTRKIVEVNPESKVVVCSEGGTGYASDIVATIIMNKAIAFGALRAIKKPFGKKELLDTVSKVLAN